MATPFSAPILSSTSPALSSNRVNPDLAHQKPTPGSSSSASWWTPLFGWSSEPDYIGNTGSNISSNAIKTGPSKEVSAQKADPETGRCRSKFRPGCFTEDKAKELRRMTTQSSNFHDVMYHSAIASRLASDVSGR
ncbi:PREDICTED: uncharacterized protein LOC109206546 [Nicotiana attenuata]|uniref:Uncharacterized protein n=1 Tax=Nicotiana attenuata TaxID=49451 RepID=A0A314KWG8_NICAT|nr:PREDICTED: uncharacterized protein LOC109206546 [Nicotiana attenuata]OIT33024.1 hypothetical protein A4A49_19255 [Nicotiana attenuata]